MYGRKGRAITPASSLVHTCKSFTGRKGGNKLRSLSDTWHSLIIEQIHCISYYSLWASDGPSIEMDQATNTCMAPITYLAQVIQGQRHSVLDECVCAAFRDGFTPKSRLLCRRQKVIPCQKPCPELDATCAWPQHWGCRGTWYCGAHFTTLVETTVTAWASVSNLIWSQWQLMLWAKDCKTTATTNTHQHIHASLSS